MINEQDGIKNIKATLKVMGILLILIAIMLVIGIPLRENRLARIPVNDFINQYKKAVQYVSYDTITDSPETEICDGLLLQITTQPLNENQKRVFIKVSNAPDSGRNPYSIETTIIKIR